MPVTRSQKDAPSRPRSRPSDKDATGEMSGSERVTSASASSGTATTSDSSGTTTTEDTTTTETTVATATTATTAASKDETTQKETTKKTPEDIPDKGIHGSAKTLKPKRVSRRARSTKTTSSSARRRELEAREELARMVLKQAQAAAKLARIRLELAQCEDEDSVDEDQEDRTEQVQNWIETSVMEENNMGKHEQRATEEGEFSDLTMVSKFLNSEADECGAFATSEEKSGFRRTHRQATHSTREKDFKEKDTRQSTEKTCPMCQGRHFLVDCQKFQKTSVQDRWATVKKSHVCFKCLQGKHRKESCKKPPCKECKRWHHHLLHVESENRISGEKKAETQEEVASVMTLVNAVNNARAYLKIVPVEVFGSKGSKRILALMDERWQKKEEHSPS
ncbi:unnamed protein product [Parnassius apollo]|uniref:(apollo) hypothetical protein n=1 Tax=Parnassius apollo TaxID=110799 RepID=A0A8S3W5B1_PARAO|nr:unnamed protein product [Parnassius apollo]